MASAEFLDFLSRCPSPEAGCFASDPDAFTELLCMDDAVIRADFGSLASAATEAAIASTPIEEATYAPATLEIFGTTTGTNYFGRPYTASEATIGTSPTVIRVLDEGTDSIAKLRQRIATCAYACGATEVGCPLRTAPEA